MSRFTHHLRFLLVALAAVWTMALNHQQVVVARVQAAPKSGKSALTARRNVVVVRERVSLESTHADVFSVAGPAVAWFPADPLGEWLTEQSRATVARISEGATRAALPVAAVSLMARLVGTSLSPQAP